MALLDILGIDGPSLESVATLRISHPTGRRYRPEAWSSWLNRGPLVKGGMRVERYPGEMGWLPPSPDSIAMCQGGGVESQRIYDDRR